jgi:zinc protease
VNAPGVRVPSSALTPPGRSSIIGRNPDEDRIVLRMTLQIARGAAALAVICLLMVAGCGVPASPPVKGAAAVPGATEAGTDWSKVVDPRTLQAPPLEFKVPAVERLVLANGMVVYLMEDHLLPLVKAYAVIRTGAIYEPADKAGLASLTGAVMRTGGTEAMSPDELNDALEFVAARVEVSFERERGIATLDVLTKDLDTGLGIFADILRRPRFDEAKIALRKAELAEEFRRENDDPAEMLFREFRELLYGRHPYARRVTGYPETVAAITRADLVEFHRRFVHPNAIIMGVSGDFEREAMLAKLEQVFGDWPRADLDLPEPPPIPTTFDRALRFVEKDLVQSNVVIGHLGIDRLDPDYYAAYVLNEILGGSGFNSRLVEDVRTKAGLAYDVGSAFQAPRYTGFFFAYCFTKTASTPQAVLMILDELGRVRREAVSNEEFDRAKRSIENQFVFRFETAEWIVEQKAEIEYAGLPMDYLERYLDIIRAVTKEDLMRVAQRLIHPDRATILVIGKPEAIQGFPADFGTFEPLKLDETPVSGLVEPAAPPEAAAPAGGGQ